ncbi:metallophosphoesterase family protein [Kineosporia babensis]|uniref:Metallophosphatase family protein n=1 Tax=Kineosporia babensis TaxID=499548 RepID=A0A9X1NAT4_9ACTN|nr:metallophosphoesterase family protein [Kineosporia babensis]MCD5311542.1 metallophosphatase family protein [Kineosporia babensis]
MRVAVLADVHGNLPALDAVLVDAERAGVDAFVLNGDFVTGPMPAQTLDRLAALGDRVIWVHGNCEREVLHAYGGGISDGSQPSSVWATTEYAAAQLSPAHRNLIDDLPLSVRLDIDDLGPVRFCHATTRSDTEIVLVDSSVDRYREAFASTSEATVVLGHTHMPFDRLADRRRFVNPGSVGMPYAGVPGAYWALLGPSVVLRRSEYDAEAAARLFRAQAPDYPGLAEFIDENLLSIPSDAEALAVFSKI